MAMAMAMAASYPSHCGLRIMWRPVSSPRKLHLLQNSLDLLQSPSSKSNVNVHVCVPCRQLTFQVGSVDRRRRTRRIVGDFVPSWRSHNQTAAMTIGAKPLVKDGSLLVNGKVVLTGVPGNIVVSPVQSSDQSVFVGAKFDVAADRHVSTLGVLKGYNFLSLYRFKIWWMIPRIGKSGSEVQLETQLLLLEAKEESALEDDDSEQKGDSTFYILFLPLLEGQFRVTLQGSPENELQFCVESGDPRVQTSQVSEAVLVNYGDNPYQLMKDSIKLVEKRKGTFHHIDNKKVPEHLDWFGWCTWDAFYQNVTPQGIREGLESFSEGGVRPKFLIIDDGWQDTFNEFVKEGEPPKEGVQFATRLVDIKENSKFKVLTSDDYATFAEFISFVKERHGLKYVYVWHALVGYWGGLLPSSDALKNVRGVAMDSIEEYGRAVIDPEKIYDFYIDQHSFLASIGDDGVKVDVQNVIETVGSGYGGRVALSKEYQYALEESVAKNFKENNLICCMSHSSDNIYSSKKSATARASEDFMPREPTLQTLHVASVAFNSLLLGEIVVPDWDMFHSVHSTADFHAACRAIGGCAVYVSDKPGAHDFKVLKKLVLPDGSILRARYAGRPTRDCLFKDPVMDGESLLKIWNLNKLVGVVGVFNCQGAGNWPLMK
ncbi:putative galactinol--sucrose galactosyltransferase 2, partial [Drosera capensis]